MSQPAKVLSRKQREIQARELDILRVARQMFFEQGFYGLTMGKIADRIGCAKGTVYLHFPCKEDLILALAEQCHERRQALFARAMQFEGGTRERALAFAYAAEVYTRVNPGDMQIFRTITPSLREKVSEQRERDFEAIERFAMHFLIKVVDDGVLAGDLELPPELSAGELAFGLWTIVDGGYNIIQSGVSLDEMDVAHPYRTVMRFTHIMADRFGWRPLSTEFDYDATVARIRDEVFPEEGRQLAALDGEA